MELANGGFSAMGWYYNVSHAVGYARPNNRMDVDKIANFSIVDFGQILTAIAATNPELGALLNVPSGSHSLFLDEFMISEKGLPVSTDGALASESILDEFTRPQAAWIGIGSVTIRTTTAQPLETPALRADFHEGPKGLMGLMKPLKLGKLVGKSQLSFTAASLKPTSIIVQFEETDGGKYNASVNLPGGSTKKEVTLSFADFKQADDSKDDNNKLDLDKVHQMLIIDISGLMGGMEQDNILWIGSLKVTAKK